MSFANKVGVSLYGIALAASLLGALVLLTGFLLAADWNYGVHILMVLYLLFSLTGTIGLLVATSTFWSKRPIFVKVGLMSNIETLVFACALALGFLLDKPRDYSPMIVGISRSISILISAEAWFVIPVMTSIVGTSASFLRIRELRKQEVTPWPQ